MTENYDPKCNTCLSIQGIIPLFPESKMYDGKYWIVEHAYPVLIRGWIVIILKRHVQALHELTAEEFQELAILQGKIAKVLNTELNSSKEYSVCFAEGPGFNHIHFHMISRTQEISEELRGDKIFAMLKTDVEQSLTKEQILPLCEKIRAELNKS